MLIHNLKRAKPVWAKTFSHTRHKLLTSKQNAAPIALRSFQLYQVYYITLFKYCQAILKKLIQTKSINITQIKISVVYFQNV